MTMVLPLTAHFESARYDASVPESEKKCRSVRTDVADARIRNILSMHPRSSLSAHSIKAWHAAYENNPPRHCPPCAAATASRRALSFPDLLSTCEHVWNYRVACATTCKLVPHPGAHTLTSTSFGVLSRCHTWRATRTVR